MRNTIKSVALLSLMASSAWSMANDDINIEYTQIIHTLSVHENNTNQSMRYIEEDKHEWADTLLRYSRKYDHYNGFHPINSQNLQNVLVLRIPECDVETKLALIDLYRERYNRLVSEINQTARLEQVSITNKTIGSIYESLSRSMNIYIRECSIELIADFRSQSNRYKFQANNLFVKTDGFSFMTYG